MKLEGLQGYFAGESIDQICLILILFIFVTVCNFPVKRALIRMCGLSHSFLYILLCLLELPPFCSG